MVTSAFLVALAPLLSVAYTVVRLGAERFDAEFFTYSMRGVVGEGGGAYHAIIGTLLVTRPRDRDLGARSACSPRST